MQQLLDTVPLRWQQRRFGWWPISPETMWGDPPSDADRTQKGGLC
jgi:hypothetical protein